MQRRSFLAVAVPLVLSGCFRRDDGTQPGTGGGPRGDTPGAVVGDPDTTRLGVAGADDGGIEGPRTDGTGGVGTGTDLDSDSASGSAGAVGSETD